MTAQGPKEGPSSQRTTSPSRSTRRTVTLSAYRGAMGGKQGPVVEFPDRPPAALTGLAPLDDPSEIDRSPA